ncbi:MAG: hypothetical protein HPM95_06040 [Alphaproteobacteria bacterium]|nr:hypothetical protein [Alphaproteobacteria bacterium]
MAGLTEGLAAGVRLYAPPRAALLELHDKLMFARKMRALALPVPETHPADSDAGKTLAADRAYVLKPANSCAGLGVSMHAAGTPCRSTTRVGIWWFRSASTAGC